MNVQQRFRLSRLALCVALAVGSASVHAQNTTAAVAGKITSTDGKAVAGATVTVLHVDSGVLNTLATDGEGRYILRGLRVGGPYTITVTKDGVSEKREGVYLQLAETTAVDAKLGGAQKVDTVVVTGSSLSSDKFSNTAIGAGTSLGRAELETLPSIQRNLQDFARTDPRVAQTDKERGEISVGGQNSRFNKITIDGVNISDTFGLEANTLPTVKQPISIDAIQSVQVNVSNYDVSQTGYTGGNINAVTKSGTNQIKGTVSYVFRDDGFVGQRYSRSTDTYTDAPKFEESTKGFTLGGPIIKDKLFFYVGYEELKSSRNVPDVGPIGSSASSISPISATEISSVQTLAQSAYGINAGSLETTGRELIVKDTLAKVDWNISTKHRASLRYTKTEQTEPIFPTFFATAPTAISLNSHWYSQDKVIETLVGQWFADWSPTFSTEAKISNREYHSEPINNTNLPAIQFTFNGALPAGAPSGIAVANRSINIGTERSRHFNILDTKTNDLYLGANLTRGDHELKALFEYSENKIYNAFLQDTKGNYTFSCVNSSATYTYTFGTINCGTATNAQVDAAVFENFTRGRPSSYLVQVPLNAGGSLNDGVATFKLNNQGVAVQDTWTLNPNLTLQFGVRVDTPLMPQKTLANAAAAAPVVAGTVSGTTVTRATGGFGLDNTVNIDGDTLIQPRFGFNYTFNSKRPTQVRGGVGLFQGAAANVWISNIYSNTGVATRVVGCGTAGFAACPSAGGIFRADPAAQITNFAGAAPSANVDFLQPGLGQPAVWKANLGIEHQLPWWDIVASFEYLGTQTQSGLYYQHLNLGAPVRNGPDGRQMYYTPTALNAACWNATGGRITTGTVAGVNCGADNRARALSNAAFNNVLLAAKTNNGRGQLATMSLSGRAFKSLDWSLAYTYTEQTEVSGLTSSVANSNWNSRAIYNPNDNVASNSAYLTKDRISATLRWEKQFFKGYKTRFGMFFEGRSGKPYSWTFSNDMNGDANGGNDLMYIPRAFGSGDVLFLGDSAGNRANEQRFWDIVNSEGSLAKYAGRTVERNTAFSPWTNSVDVNMSQELPSFIKGHKAVVVFDILNFGNLLNKRWGRITEMAFNGNGGQTRSFVNFVGIDQATGKNVYSVSNRANDFTDRQARGESQWGMQVTLRYEF